MFGYYFRLGLASLRRNPVLTALMVATLAVGVAASMSTLTILYVLSGDPIPGKSDQLFVPRLDNGAASTFQEGNPPAEQLTYMDASNFLAQAPAERQTALLGLTEAVQSGRADLPPFLANGIAINADFFGMFGLGFLEGGAWSERDDAAGGDVVVLSESLAERLFGEEAALDRMVRIGEHEYRVTGVVETWRPLPKFYRMVGGNQWGGWEEFFLPFQTAATRELDPSGSVNCDTDAALEPGYDGLKRSECVWIQFWAELPDAAAEARYRDWMDAYVAEQKALGRFPRPLNNELHDVMDWLADRGVVTDDSRLQVWLAFGFLLVCVVNTVGLLLAKFTARAGDIGVRRALGASRGEIFRQYLTEAAVIGVAGGAVGLVFTLGGLWLMGRQSAQLEAAARMDWAMLGTTLLVAVAASIVAGLIPTWRACQVTPALQLKSQ